MRGLVVIILAMAAGASSEYIPIGRNCSDPDDLLGTDITECGSVLICDSGHCRECAMDAECQEVNGPEYACIRFDKKGDRICAHKHLLPPDSRDYAAILLSILLCALSAGGGIGGGGLLLPMLILLLAFTPHEASPLANATVLGGAVANLAHYAGQLHPSGRRALISYEVALMMEPMTLAGALAGVLLNKIFPGWLITILLVLVLGITTQRTLKKGLDAWRKESAAASIAAANPEAAASLLGSPNPPGGDRGGRNAGGDSGNAGGDSGNAGGKGEVTGGGAAKNASLAAVLAEEASHPLYDVATLVLSLLACTALSVLRGPNRQQSPLRIRCGSREYWLALSLQLCVLLGVSVATRRTLLRRHERRKAAGYDFLPDDVMWTPFTSFAYPLLCAIAGLCAGLFGIGGGIVKGPLMLEMGMLPQVASATSAFMIFFTAASATLQFAMLGDIRPVYACTLFLAGLVGTAVGQRVVSVLLRRSGRQSLIVLILAFIIGGSTIVMSIVGVFNFMDELKEGKSQGFRPLCESSLVGD